MQVSKSGGATEWRVEGMSDESEFVQNYGQFSEVHPPAQMAFESHLLANRAAIKVVLSLFCPDKMPW